MSELTTPTDEQTRVRLLLGILAAVVVLGGLWMFVISPLLIGGTDGDVGAPDTSGEAPVSGDPDAAPGNEGSDESPDVVLTLPIETYEVFLSRDPFEPVIPDAAPGGDGADPGDGGADGDGAPDGGGGDGDPGGGDPGDGGQPGVVTDAAVVDVFVDDQGRERALIRVGDVLYTVGEGDAFDDGYVVISIASPCVTLERAGEAFTLCEGGASAPGDDAGGGTTEGCSGTDEVVCEGRVVTLVDVFTDAAGAGAVVQVDSTLYEVRVRDQFAENFQVIAIDPPCVTLLFGDDAFTLCEGERTLK